MIIIIKTFFKNLIYHKNEKTFIITTIELKFFLISKL